MSREVHARFCERLALKCACLLDLRTVGGQLGTTTFIENIVSVKKQKKLSLKVTLTVQFAMSLVGVLTFFLWKIQNFTTMVTKMTSVVVGIALAGRKATIFHTIRH